MIEFIHKYPILIKVLLTITTVAFVATGGFLLGQDSAVYVAHVGDEKISRDQLQKEIFTLEDFYRKIYQGNVPEDLMKNIDLTGMALDQLIERSVILISADDMGLAVSDKEVADTVRTNPSFLDEQGNFNKAVYSEVLRYNNLTPKEFERQLRENLLIEKFRKIVTDSVVVTEDDERRYFAEQSEAQGLEFDEKAFEEKRPMIRAAVENDMKLKVMKAVIDELKSGIDIKIDKSVLPSA